VVGIARLALNVILFLTGFQGSSYESGNREKDSNAIFLPRGM
jgi:hypothetical protein